MSNYITAKEAWTRADAYNNVWLVRLMEDIKRVSQLGCMNISVKKTKLDEGHINTLHNLGYTIEDLNQQDYVIIWHEPKDVLLGELK